MNLINLPSTKELIILIVCLACWLGVTALFIGLRSEHLLLSILISALFILNRQTRKLVVALLPFALFGISYDWMRILPNYTVNTIHIKELYEAEKHLFGITLSTGNVVTPNEFFALHHTTIVDVLAGIFYLCWVPVPLLFGIGLYISGQREGYLHFALVFLLVNLLGFIGYYIYPAAPPWYVAQYGYEAIMNTPGDVAGLGRFDSLTGLNIFHSLYARNANVFAAVPSLHSAYMVVTLYYALRTRTPAMLRWTFGIIMLGIWFTAVYTSHHYLIDVISGALCACLGIYLFEKYLKLHSIVGLGLNRYVAYIR